MDKSEERNKIFEEVFKEANMMTKEENLRENIQLQEMAVYRKNESGLPANLYLDDAGTWKNSGHWKRIKFQADKGDHPNTRSMVPMSISNNPEIMSKNPDIKLSNGEIDEIKTFVVNNLDLLLNLENLGMKHFYANVKL